MSLDRIEERLDRISELQAEMNGSLKEHMRRTELAEAQIVKLAEELKPVQNHVIGMQSFFRIIIAIVTVAAAAAALWQSLK